MAWSPDGTLLLAGGGADEFSVDSSAYLWRVADGTLLAQLNRPVLLDGKNPVVRVAFAPDGRTLAVLTGRQELRFWPVP